MAQKRLIFTSNWTTVWHHGMVHATLNTHLPSFHSPIAPEEQRPSLQTPTCHTGGSSSVFRTIVLKTAQKRPFLDTKSAVERASRLKKKQNLFVVMRLCSPVVLSYLDAGFQRCCGRKNVWTAAACCCCLLLLLLLLAKTCSSALDPKRWCKTSTG